MDTFYSYLNHSLVLSLATVVFFTVKGLMWLVIPAMVLRIRNRRMKCREECVEIKI